MKQITIQDTQYNLPESWKEVTLQQLCNYRKLDLQSDEDSNTVNIITSTRILEVLTSVPIGTFGKFKMTEVIPAFLEVAALVGQEVKWVVPGKFQMNGRTHSFIKLNNITMDEMAAIDMFQRKNGEYWDQISYIIAICCRPLDFKGNIEEFNSSSLEQRRLDLLNHSCLDTYMFATFFLTGHLGYKKNSQSSTKAVKLNPLEN